MNEQIYSLFGTIGASPYMAGQMRMNSQYARIEMLLSRNMPEECIAVCGDLFGHLMERLYDSIMGETQPISVIINDIAFWSIVDDQVLCDMACMLHYALYRLQEAPDGQMDGIEAAKLIKESLEAVVARIASFLQEQGRWKCLDPVALRRPDVREQIQKLCDALEGRLKSAGYRDGISMEPPYTNVCLLNFPDGEPVIWAGYVAKRLQRMNLLAAAKVNRLDAKDIVRERVSLATECIRRTAEEANGGALLIDNFQEFDAPCVGGNLMERALKTILATADKYRGSLCIVVAGRGENMEKALLHTNRVAEIFPLTVSISEIWG